MRTRLLLLFCSALAFVACVDESFLQGTKKGILINLVLNEPQTRTEKAGNASLNENVISSTIDLFFYNESTGAITKEVLGAVRSGNLVQIQTNPNDVESIFGTVGAGAKCGLFVVANFAGTYNGTANSRNISDIKESLLPAPNWEALPQTSFVLTGEQQITLRNAQGSTPVNETVPLSRVAAKVTFDVTVAENATGESSSWTPDTGNMSVYMVYAMRKATLGAEPVDMPVTKNETYTIGNTSAGTIVYEQYNDKVLHDTGTTKLRSRRDGNSTTTVSSPVYSTDVDGAEKPFYTYPLTWETGSAMEPYMKLIIPWTANNVTKKYYYKIPFHGNALERNHWYQISIDVQILGTEQADPPAVDIHYAIADWSGEIDTATAEDITSITSVPATVITTRYLNVPTTEYILYDKDDLIIPILSSHDVEIVGFNIDTNNAYKAAHINDDSNYVGIEPRLYNPYLSTLNTSATNAVRPNYKNDPPTPVSDGSWTVTPNGRESISVYHALNRTMSSDDFDVAPYTIRFRVRHQSESDNYFVDVTIEQRPAIIIKPERNSDNGTVNSSGHTTEDGYVFINNVRTNTDQSTGRSNTNFNMYIVETSVLPADEGSALKDYVLGDPRTTSSVSYTSGKAQSDFSSNGKDIATGSARSMANYYPAAEDEDHNVFIAPSFRIASSFGTSSAMSRADALHRCATYQEDGYPAGRWRLPTRAEIQYMVTLSQKEKIPTLFSAESNINRGGYWCSAGAVFPLTDGSVEYRDLATASSMTIYNSRNQRIGTGVHWARCVYDEWYWSGTIHEKAADKTVFTWGDEAKDTVSKQ